MSWEPNTEENETRKTRDNLEDLKQAQFFSTSSINSSSITNSMGTSSNMSGFNFDVMGDIVEGITNSVNGGLGELYKILSGYVFITPDASETNNTAVINKIGNGTGNTVDKANLPQDGQLLTLRPEAGKSLTLINSVKTGLSSAGNLLLGSDITLTESESITLRYQNLIKYADAINGVSENIGGWIVHSTGGGLASTNINTLKDPVKVASTGNNSLHPAWGSTIDGIGMVAGDRFLVKDQTTQADNGIYIWGTGALGVSVRASDMSHGSVQKEGTMTYVQDGLTQNERLYAIDIGGNNILIGTNPNTWGEIGSGGGGSSGSIKSPVKYATTANITLSGEQSIDGTTTVTNRVLVKDQTTSSENGIYVTATGAWARSTDMSTGSTIEGGTMVYVTDGTVNGDNLFGLTTEGTVTVGTGNQVWANLTGGGWVGTATSDLNMNTFNINVLDQLIFSSAVSSDLPVWNTSDYGMEISGGTTPTGLDYRIPSLKTHKFLVNTTKIAEINSTSLDMNAHKITSVLNPTNPQDAMTLDYFNTNGIWLELDGSTTMIGHINAGNYNLINVNDILTTRSDGTARLQTTGGSATSDFVGLYLSTNTDYFLRQGTDYIFEWDKSDGEFTIFTDVILGDANTDRITFNAKSASILDMNANKITGVQNPSNPTDVVTLDYFNSTGDTQWLELDGTGTMTGNINTGNNNLINVNDILTTRQDGTSRLITSGGTATSNFVGLTLATGTDYYLRKSASDGSGYVFEWDNSVPSFKLSVPTIIDSTLQVNGNITLGNANTDTITFTAKSATELNMDAHKITGVLNPTNPTDVVTLDYFNSTGDTQWLELDGTGTMTGNINVGNNNVNNVNAVNVVRSDSTARMAIQGGTGATTQVLFDAVTNVDVRFTEALADRFEIQNSTNTIRSHVDLNMEGNNILNGSIDTSLIDSGILGITRGGTGNSSNTRGDILYSPIGNNWSRLPVGSANQVLTSDGTDVSWQNAGGGGSQTPWTSNIDANGFDLTGLDDITFNNGHTFKQNSAGLTMNVLASNDYIKLQQAVSTRFEITNTGGIQISSGLGATALLELRTGNGSYTPFSMGDGVNTTLGVGGNDDLIFKEGSATVCTYSGTLDKWLFTGGSGGFNISVNGVQKILFGNDINITDEIQMSGDIDFASGNYPDLHDTAPTASSFAGYVIIKVRGVNKKLIYYDM